MSSWFKAPRPSRSDPVAASQTNALEAFGMGNSISQKHVPMELWICDEAAYERIVAAVGEKWTLETVSDLLLVISQAEPVIGLKSLVTIHEQIFFDLGEYGRMSFSSKEFGRARR